MTFAGLSCAFSSYVPPAAPRLIERFDLAQWLQSPHGHYVEATPRVTLWTSSSGVLGLMLRSIVGEHEMGQILSVLSTWLERATHSTRAWVWDFRGVDGVSSDAFSRWLQWLQYHRAQISTRVAQQANVLSIDAPFAPSVCGIAVLSGAVERCSTHRDLRSALVGVDASIEAEATWIEEWAADRRSQPDLVSGVRAFLRANPTHANLAAVARGLGTSTRTLQRALQVAGTTLREEVRAARFDRAVPLLLETEEKISLVARRVGVSESTLTEVIRQQTGATPAELRRSRAQAF